MSEPAKQIEETAQPVVVQAVPTQAAPVGTSMAAAPGQAAPVATSMAASQPLQRMGHQSTTYTCMYCQATAPTRVQEKIGVFSIIMMVVLILLFWPIFWLPLVMPGCKDKDHICSNCGRQVGKAEAGCDSCCN